MHLEIRINNTAFESKREGKAASGNTKKTRRQNPAALQIDRTAHISAPVLCESAKLEDGCTTVKALEPLTMTWRRAPILA
jgi:hypothetical protein